MKPEELEALAGDRVAIGDGALLYRDRLARVADDPRLHHVHGAALCALAAAAEPIGRDELLPDYVREPDAKPRA